MSQELEQYIVLRVSQMDPGQLAAVDASLKVWHIPTEEGVFITMGMPFYNEVVDAYLGAKRLDVPSWEEGWDKDIEDNGGQFASREKEDYMLDEIAQLRALLALKNQPVAEPASALATLEPAPKVVPLAQAAYAVVPQIVAAAEEFLSQANQGKVNGYAIVWRDHNHAANTNHYCLGQTYAMIGHVEWLKHKLLRYVGNED